MAPVGSIRASPGTCSSLDSNYKDKVGLKK